MTIKHKVIQDFQLMLIDKTIFVLKSGSIIEDYKFKSKNELIEVDQDIINANPQYFQIVDWKAELISYMRQNKFPTPSVLGKKLTPFIEEMFIISSEKPANNDLEKEYRSKLKALGERESLLEKEYRSKLREISEKESDYEIKIQKFEKRGTTLEEEYEQLSNKEADVRRKIKELREKEESLKDTEFEIINKEKNLERKEEDLNIREKEIQSLDVNKLTDLKDRLNTYYNSIPWHHNNMSSYQSGLIDIIRDF